MISVSRDIARHGKTQKRIASDSNCIVSRDTERHKMTVRVSRPYLLSLGVARHNFHCSRSGISVPGASAASMALQRGSVLVNNQTGNRVQLTGSSAALLSNLASNSSVTIQVRVRLTYPIGNYPIGAEPTVRVFLLGTCSSWRFQRAVL
jgi:hypothetical protein